MTIKEIYEELNRLLCEVEDSNTMKFYNSYEELLGYFHDQIQEFMPALENLAYPENK